MIEKIINYFKGSLRIRITGFSPERFLNACMYREIYIWNIQPVQDHYEMNIRISDFRRLKPILKKTGVRAVIIKRYGFPFFMFHHKRRKVLFGGAVCAGGFIYIMSLFIWQIDITGNRRYTDEALEEFLGDHKIRPGIRVSDIDCADIAALLRKSYDRIIWVSVSVDGNKLKVCVRENEDSGDESAPTGTSGQEQTTDQTQGQKDGSDLVAEQAGVIESMIVRKGIPLVKEGDTVGKGQILVSGAVPVINDAGETTGYQYHRAEADIRARTLLAYEDTVNVQYAEKVYYDFQKQEPYLQIGNLYLCTGKPDVTWNQAEIYTIEKSFSAGEHFSFPIRIGSRISRYYHIEEKMHTEKSLQQILSRNYQHFTDTLEKKGVEIISNDVKIYTGRICAKASGQLNVITDIAVQQPISIMEDNTDGDD